MRHLKSLSASELNIKGNKIADEVSNDSSSAFLYNSKFLYTFFNFPDDLDKLTIALSCGIGQPPVFIKGSADERTPDIAPHGDSNVGCGDHIVGFALLCFFHVDTIQFLHKPHSVLIDLRFGFCSAGVKVISVACKVSAKSLSNLAAAGVVHADKCYFLFQWNGHLSFVH